MSSLNAIFSSARKRHKSSCKKKKNANTTESLFDESSIFINPPPQNEPTKPKPASPPDPPQTINLTEGAIQDDAAERTVFVGNLSLAVKQLPKKLKRHFGIYGDVESVRLRSVPSAAGDNAPKRVIVQNRRFDEDRPCNAYVVFKQSESAQAALALNMTTFHGTPIRVDVAGQPRFLQKRKQLTSIPGNFTAKDSIIVKHLDKAVSDQALLSLFNDGQLLPSCKDTVRNWRIVRDHKTGDSRGYAFLAFKHTSAAKAALTLDGHTLGQHTLSIEPIRPKSSRSSNRGQRKPPRQRQRQIQKRHTWGGTRTKGPFKVIKGSRVKR